MNQVSQFSVNDPSTIIIQKPLSLTPNTIHYKSHPQSTHSTVTSQNHHQSPSPSPSSYKCQQCPEHLSTLTQIKKREIKLQYEIQRLKQQMQHLKRENQHLKQLRYNSHQEKLQKYNPIMYFKQDLQAELYEAKYLLQLHTLSSTKPSQHTQINNNPNTKHPPSQKQQQSLQKLSKPIDLKTKCQQLLLENIKLQQKLMIKEKIIQERVLFPLYHYDERVLMLRKAVEYWYRRAQQEAGRLAQVMVEVKKCQKQLKREAKTMLMQQKAHWQNQIKKVMLMLQSGGDNQTIYGNSLNTINNTLQTGHNQTEQKQQHSCQYQKQLLSKTYNHNNNNILIEDDHTIYSLCEKIHSSKQKETCRGKQKMTKRNSIKNPNILCESCLNMSAYVQGKKKSKNCSMINGKKQQKSINKVTVSGKTSAKNENKYDTGSVERKSEEFGKKIVKRKNCNVDANNNNSSLLGKNFENIEIKVKPKQKCEINCKKNKNPLTLTKCALSEFSCQRCAERIM